MNDRLDPMRPLRTDGRNIDQTIGALRGEGALQRISDPASAQPIDRAPWRREATADEESYFGLPLLKEAVWKWPIPAYFYVGGLSGAAAALGAAASLSGRGKLRRLSRAARSIAAVGSVVSGALLIEDLGVRRRFVYMMRVFRPTSPMNLGTWLLAAFGGSAAAALLPGKSGDAAAVASGMFGLPLTGYTGVLLANTAVPLWQGARTTLPPAFVAGAAASAACAFELLTLSRREERVVRRLAILGKSAAVLNDLALEREVSRIEPVGRPLRQGASGALWRSGTICNLASLAVSLFPRKPRWLRLAGAAIGTLGALATRFAIVEGGKASARDPHATTATQRA